MSNEVVVKPTVEGQTGEFGEVSYKDRDNPQSLINICPSFISNAIAVIPDFIFELPFEEIRKKSLSKPKGIDDNNIVTEDTLRRLRTAFWLEYANAFNTGRKMMAQGMFNGICQIGYFAKHIAINSFRLAYVVTPPLDYIVRLEEMLDLGLEQTRDILQSEHLVPLRNKEGELIYENGQLVMVLDPKIALVKQKITEDLHNRRRGMPIHRTQSLNRNINEHREVTTEEVLADTMESLDARIAELRKKAGEVIDVQGRSDSCSGPEVRGDTVTRAEDKV